MHNYAHINPCAYTHMHAPAQLYMLLYKRARIHKRATALVCVYTYVHCMPHAGRGLHAPRA